MSTMCRQCCYVFTRISLARSVHATCSCSAQRLRLVTTRFLVFIQATCMDLHCTFPNNFVVVFLHSLTPHANFNYSIEPIHILISSTSYATAATLASLEPQNATPVIMASGQDNVNTCSTFSPIWGNVKTLSVLSSAADTIKSLEGCSAMAQAKRVCALTSIHKCMVSSEKKRSKPLSKAHTSRSSRTRTATHGEPSLLSSTPR
mmetsp:Transcript_3619/g.7069  ORF Transcript_3619/g.7069 Transcript_3619/m.7069 type:complete len:204 (+) Transcript_3619:2025-2636(+)